MRNKEYTGFSPVEFTKFMGDFLEKMKFFRNTKGKILAVADSYENDDPTKKYLANRLFLSNDGVNFHQLHTRGFGGSGANGRYSLENPHEEKMFPFHIYWDNNMYFLMIPEREEKIEDEELQKAMKSDVRMTQEEYSAFLPTAIFHENREKMIFHPLPEIRRPEYLLYNLTSVPDFRFIYVDGVTYNSAYEHMPLFIGRTPFILEERKVTGFNRLRDGGTTFIRTNEGELCVSSPLSNPDGSRKSKWTPLGKEAIEFLLFPKEVYKASYNTQQHPELVLM